MVWGILDFRVGGSWVCMHGFSGFVFRVGGFWVMCGFGFGACTGL